MKLSALLADKLAEAYNVQNVLLQANRELLETNAAIRESINVPVQPAIVSVPARRRGINNSIASQQRALQRAKQRDADAAKERERLMKRAQMLKNLEKARKAKKKKNG